MIFGADLKACFSPGVGDGRGRKRERRAEREGRMKMKMRMRMKMYSKKEIEKKKKGQKINNRKKRNIFLANGTKKCFSLSVNDWQQTGTKTVEW